MWRRCETFSTPLLPLARLPDSFLYVRDVKQHGWAGEMRNSEGDCHVHLCVGACVSTPSPYLRTCLFVFFSFPPHDIKTLAGKMGLANACAGTEHMNADKVGQESTTRMFWPEACICVCEYVWPVSYIFGVKIFSCTDKNKIKNKKQKRFRSCLEGLAKESSADQYKILELQLKIIDSLPIRVFPKA